MGLIGHEIITKGDENWKEYGQKLATLDWSRTAEHWQGVLVNNGKIITSQSAVKQAVKMVRELIGWNFELGDPAPVQPALKEATRDTSAAAAAS
jgi:hypothetical protein